MHWSQRKNWCINILDPYIRNNLFILNMLHDHLTRFGYISRTDITVSYDSCWHNMLQLWNKDLSGRLRDLLHNHHISKCLTTWIRQHILADLTWNILNQTAAAMKKRHLTIKKLQEKVSQWFIVVSGGLDNISKVHQNLITGNVKISRWPPPVFFLQI